MAQADQQAPDDGNGKPERDALRDARRAEALRANLKRRKAQLRGRAAAADDAADDLIKSP